MSETRRDYIAEERALLSRRIVYWEKMAGHYKQLAEQAQKDLEEMRELWLQVQRNEA